MAERLTYRTLIEQCLGLFSLERGLVATIRDLSLRPGAMLRGYLDGSQRHRYMGVVSYMVLMAGTASALFVFFPPEDLFAAMQAGLSESPSRLDPERFVELYRSFLARYYQLLVFVPVPLMALATRWVLASLRYNYLEHLVVNGFAAAQITLISIVGYPLLHLAGENAGTVNNWVQTIGVVYGFWLLIQLAGNYRPVTFLKTAAAGIVGIAIVGAVSLISVLGYALLNVQQLAQGRQAQMSWDAATAETAFSEAMQALPVPEMRMQYALLLAQIGRTEEALENAEGALRVAPDSAGLRHQLGIVALFAGDIERARRSMESVLEITDQTTVWVDLCRLEAGAGNRARALEHAANFERIDLYRGSIPLQAVLAYCYRMAGAPDEANRVAAALDLSADGASAIAAAYASLAVGDVEAAVRHLERTITETVELPEAANIMYLKLNVFGDPVLERPELAAVRDRTGFRN